MVSDGCDLDLAILVALLNNEGLSCLAFRLLHRFVLGVVFTTGDSLWITSVFVMVNRLFFIGGPWVELSLLAGGVSNIIVLVLLS